MIWRADSDRFAPDVVARSRSGGAAPALNNRSKIASARSAQGSALGVKTVSALIERGSSRSIRSPFIE